MENTQPKKKSSHCLTLTIILLIVLGYGWYKGSEDRKSKGPISQCLSGWNGSHSGLVSYVKNGMNDPGSFEHVSTVYYDQTTRYRLVMTFRGKNKFGGVVTQTADAMINTDCELIGQVVIY